MDDHLDGAGDRRLQTLPCRNLRAQTCGGECDGSGLEQVRDTPTSAYWCVLTMKPFGPDGGVCEPDACGPGRACCRPVRRPKLA